MTSRAPAPRTRSNSDSTPDRAIESGSRLGDRNAAVHQARRQLLEEGAQTALVGVEPWIARSWQRCLASGKQPDHGIVFAPNARPSQRRLTDEHQGLLSAARHSMLSLGGLVSGIGYFALLTNAEGLVIDVAGAVDRSDPMAAAIAQVGVDLSEESAGTSAICTALQEKHSVWLHRHEHFFEATSVYSCAGAPLFNPRGRCIGMLDLTGIRVREQRQLIHLVSQYAREIERAVLVQEEMSLLLRVRWPGATDDASPCGLLSVADSGALLGADFHCRSMIPELSQMGQRGMHLSDVFAMPWQSLFDQSRASVSLREWPLWSGLNLVVAAEQVRAKAPETRTLKSLEAEPDLALPALSPTQAPASAANKSLKAVQSELISLALLESKGNVELAARRLGISRATLYRKLHLRH
jgi:sigma-54 dependent transcriptional regulator, acetoin dehydrogenase operon transcriptional activator AcoR